MGTKEAFIERTLRVYEHKRTGVHNITTSVPDLRVKAELAWVARCGEDATGLRDYSESHQLRAMLLLVREATAEIDWLAEIEAQPTSFADSTVTLQAVYKKYLRQYLSLTDGLK